ncbi:sensor domain-containing protein [Neobacillus dielmonensis]|uniref:sensor domain-containing protein n=1 Tax=Neobacillus dielmonensis TaxID=1347369 RepID=UPI0006950BCA|nr:EAL domain-containing protein [Neobacillus dielmonensis]
MSTPIDRVFRTMLEDSMAGSYIWQDNKFVYVNPRLAEMLGYEPKEICGQENILNRIIAPDELEKIRKKAARTLTDEQGEDTFQVQINNKQGYKLVLDIYSKGTTFQNSPAIVGIVIDMTKQNNLYCQKVERNMETELLKALERQEFFLHFQPKIDGHSGVMVGTEALLRWRSPSLGLVSPGDFISCAEDLGLIVPIGEWVLKEACRQNKQWQRQGLRPICVAVNVSAHQIYRSNLVETIQRVLKQTGLEAKWLEIEITEGTLIKDGQSVIETLKAIKDLGVQISIDDFGTGYSSLSYLKRLPIHSLKIDRSFIKDIDKNQDNQKITEAIIQLAHSLNMKTVCEGVETNSEFQTIKTLQTDEIQGYYISKPISVEDHIPFFSKKIL